MEDERNTFFLSADEILEAEELNSLSGTRMTDAYRRFLDEKLGEITEPVLPEMEEDADESAFRFADETDDRYASGFRSNMAESGIGEDADESAFCFTDETDDRYASGFRSNMAESGTGEDADESAFCFADETDDRYASGFRNNMAGPELHGSFSTDGTGNEEPPSDSGT